MSLPVSVYIITLNAEKTLRQTLVSVEGFDEIIVVDSGSSDATLEIARQAGCRVEHQDWLGFAGQKALALELCRHDWVLNLDADETLSARLRAEIERTIARDDCDGLESPMIEYFLGRANRGLTRANSRVRFFRRDRGGYTDVEVHESIQVSGRVRKSRGGIYHYGVDSISSMVDKSNRYSELRARDKFMRGKGFSLLKLLLIFPLMFLKGYLFKRSFVNGTRGFIVSVNSAFYAFLKEAKLYEQHQRKRSKSGTSAVS